MKFRETPSGEIRFPNIVHREIHSNYELPSYKIVYLRRGRHTEKNILAGFTQTYSSALPSVAAGEPRAFILGYVTEGGKGARERTCAARELDTRRGTLFARMTGDHVCARTPCVAEMRCGSRNAGRVHVAAPMNHRARSADRTSWWRQRSPISDDYRYPVAGTENKFTMMTHW